MIPWSCQLWSWDSKMILGIWNHVLRTCPHNSWNRSHNSRSRSQVRMRMTGWQCSWMPASLLLYLGDLSSIPFFISATSLVFLDYQLFVELVSCVLGHVWKGPMKVAACTTGTGQKMTLAKTPNLLRGWLLPCYTERWLVQYCWECCLPPYWHGFT